MSSADAKDILSQWNGHLKHLSLLRLAPDLCTTLAVHSSKVLYMFVIAHQSPKNLLHAIDLVVALDGYQMISVGYFVHRTLP